MKLRKLHFIFLAIAIAVSSLAAGEAYAAKKRSKARTTQTTKRISTSKKKRKTSTKAKRSGRKSSGRKYSKKKRTATRVYTPPVETPSYDSLTLAVNATVVESIPANMNPGGLRVNSVKPDKASRTTKVSLNENFTYLPVTRELIDNISHSVKSALPDSIADYSITLNVANRNLAYYITKVDKLPEQFRKNIPFVVAKDPYINPKKGMEGDIIALWHSHGRYFKPGSGAWMWQRPLLFQSVEDTFTMGFILPYVVPMLENAGAYVMLPRERDINTNEVIVDNDTNDEGQIFSQPYYKEQTGSRKWTTGELEGFIYDLPDFRDTENPFENGTYRQTTTVRSGAPSVAAWYADIPEDGEYAVYVSYKSLPNSTEDAHYTVNYSGGTREFKVNQTMGGGTWVYLGTFPLEAGYSDTEPVVTLTNISEKSADKIVTADAVKIGGGMGNIARSNRRSDIYYDPSTPESVSVKNCPPDDEEEDEEADEESDDDDDDEGDDDTDDETTDGSVDGEPDSSQESAPAQQPKGPAPVFRTSGLPRFLEGARYWLHWAGAPEKVYSPYHGCDDYKDDYTSRGHWVNWLAGGSRVLPGREGLKIPVDLALALHSDAGKRADDSFVGTLGIYYTNGGDRYVDGTPRINSRMLTDMVMRQITNDVRQTLEPRWTRRSMWDKSYVEARVPEVPTTLIELLSHQNFADMQYGLDPTFRFTVGRAIYKALARFMAERKGREVVIQPLPVKDFAITRRKRGHFTLSWQPTPDALESTAMPSKYIILERTGDEMGFHKIGETHSTHFDVKSTDNMIHSFRVIAANEGGVSFPSETLAFREAPSGDNPVLIVNGFNRVSAPAHFSIDGRAGFDSENDFGVPYINDISFSGYQTEFRRSAGDGFGRSSGNHTSSVIAGNTFDYPYVHGEAIASKGRGFVSTSVGAVENGSVNMSDYKIVDLILGKQKTTVTGNGKEGAKYSVFPEKFRSSLEGYLSKGGKMFVSGQYVADDLFDPRRGAEAGVFAREWLGVVPEDSLARSRSGKIETLPSPMQSGIRERVYRFSDNLNPDMYIIENPRALRAAEGADASVMMQFTDTGLPAGYLVRKGKSRNAVMSIPFESITDPGSRTLLMGEILDFLDQ